MLHKTGIIIYYISYLIFPFLVYLTYFYFWKNRSFGILIVFVLGLFFIRIRFVEPNIIKIKKLDIESDIELKIALIADIHLGSFKNENFLNRVINKLNEQDIDIVLMAGDMTYCEDNNCNIEKLFSPIKNSKLPIYAVLGNHDVGKPGPDIRKKLQNVMQKYGVKVLNNDIIEFEDYTLVGLGSTFNQEDNTEILDNLNGKKLIVLAHNPDVIGKYNSILPEITFAGHTHGCQIKTPFCNYIIPTKLILKDGDFIYLDNKHKYYPAKGKFNEGLYSTKNGKIFVTSGLGEVGLPFRLFNFPTIDIIHLKKQKK